MRWEEAGWYGWASAVVAGFDFGHSPHLNPVWLVLGGAVAVVH
jgi:hypothetical protein